MRLINNKSTIYIKKDNKIYINTHIMRQKCCIVERKVYNK